MTIEILHSRNGRLEKEQRRKGTHGEGGEREEEEEGGKERPIYIEEEDKQW